jgi:hypothetical protein
MQQLNLPAYEPRIREDHKGKMEIFDGFRRKFVRLTPEEWVRQHFLNFLVTCKGYPASVMVVEAFLTVNRLKKRCDILVYGPGKKPILVVECKAPEIEITQGVFDQVARYNMTLTVDHLVVTNGLQHYACRIDHLKRSFEFLKDVPGYEEVISHSSLVTSHSSLS